MVRILRLRIRGHAGTRSPADQRTRTRSALGSAANAQAEHGAPVSSTGRKPVLAAPLLRFQRVDRRQASREITLHPPQPGKTRARRAPRRLAVEQLPPLRFRDRRHGGNRIAMDGAQAGADGNRASNCPPKSKSPPCRTNRDKGGAPPKIASFGSRPHILPPRVPSPCLSPPQ